MSLLFPGGKAASVVKGTGSKPYRTGKQLDQSSREWLQQQGSTRGLWQHWRRWLWQSWASTGPTGWWMPKENSSGMCEMEQGQIQLQGVLGWEEQDR